MNHSGQLWRLMVATILVIATGLLAACGQQPQADDHPDHNTPAALTINTAQQTFLKGGSATFTVTLESNVATKTAVALITPPTVRLDVNQLEFDLAANEKATRTVTAEFLGAGYASITASSALNSDWSGHSVGDMVGFNVQTAAAQSSGVRPTVATLKGQGQQSLSDWIQGLPEVKLEDDYIDFAGENILAELEGRDDVATSVRVKGLKFKKADKSDSEPVTTVMTYLRGTSVGKPDPKVIERPKNRPQNPGIRPQGWGCVQNVLSYVNVGIQRDPGGTRYPMTNTKVFVYDENPWLSPTLLAVGYTDQWGNFFFYRNNCDFGAAWDYSGPDIFFVVESVEQPNTGIDVFTFAPLYTTYGVRSGTWWDTGSTSFQVDLLASRTVSEQALWVLKQGQLTHDFNYHPDGGPVNGRFPVRVVWPTATQATMAQVTKVELRGDHWYGAYPFIHEMGHEILYAVASPTPYALTYSGGPGTIAAPYFNWDHVCHNTPPGCADDHGYNDGFAHFIYDGVVQIYGIGYIGSPGSHYRTKVVQVRPGRKNSPLQNP
jgi:hypothetical protein